MMTTLREKLGMFGAVDVAIAVAVNEAQRQAGQQDNRGSTAISPDAHPLPASSACLRLRLRLLFLCFCCFASA